MHPYRKVFAGIACLASRADQREPQRVIRERQPLERRYSADAIIVCRSHDEARTKVIAIKREASLEVLSCSLDLGHRHAGTKRLPLRIDQATARLVERALRMTLDQVLDGLEKIRIEFVVVTDQRHVLMPLDMHGAGPAVDDRQRHRRGADANARIIPALEPFDGRVRATIVERDQVEMWIGLRKDAVDAL